MRQKMNRSKLHPEDCWGVGLITRRVIVKTRPAYTHTAHSGGLECNQVKVSNLQNVPAHECDVRECDGDALIKAKSAVRRRFNGDIIG